MKDTREYISSDGTVFGVAKRLTLDLSFPDIDGGYLHPFGSLGVPSSKDLSGMVQNSE